MPLPPNEKYSISIPDGMLIDPQPASADAISPESDRYIRCDSSPVPDSYVLGPETTQIRNFEAKVIQRNGRITSKEELSVGGRTFLVLSGTVVDPVHNGFVAKGNWVFASAFTRRADRIYAFHQMEKEALLPPGVAVDKDPVFQEMLRSVLERVDSGSASQAALPGETQTVKLAASQVEVPKDWTVKRAPYSVMLISPSGNDVAAVVDIPNSQHLQPDNEVVLKLLQQISGRTTGEKFVKNGSDQIVDKGISWLRIRMQSDGFYTAQSSAVLITATNDRLYFIMLTRNDLLANDDAFDFLEIPELKAVFESFAAL